MAHAGEALFQSDRARTALDKFCAVTHLTVRMYAIDGRPLSEPVHPTPLFQLFLGDGRNAPHAVFIERLRPPLDATGPATVADDSGVATVGRTFRVDGEIVCQAVAGPLMVTHLTERDAQQIARASGLSFDAVWTVARKELPVPRQRLELYGELLQVVGETLLSDDYRARRLEEALARLETSDRAKDLFLATLSHELRTPLTAIAGWMRILQTGHPDAAALAHGLDVIARNTKLQARLIEDLLDVSRAITGKVNLDVRAVALQPIVASAIDAIRPAADTKRIRLEADLNLSPGLVSGDRDRLGQIVSNLLTNAVKFTPPDGKIGVRLRRVGSQVEIAVSDTGAGIAPEFLPHLFERFRQVNPGPMRSQGGLGLGLALVKHLTELHGGTVRAESAGVDHGATFIVTLPLLEDGRGDAASASPTTEVDISDDLKDIRVLLVEDHPDTRELLTIGLQDRGADVTAVSSAAEALKALDRRQPHVIVSDIGLNGEDGYELMRRIRAREADGLTPAVAVTALSGAEDSERAIAAGYQQHLAKPIDVAVLVRVVVKLAGRRALPDVHTRSTSSERDCA